MLKLIGGMLMTVPGLVMLIDRIIMENLNGVVLIFLIALGGAAVMRMIERYLLKRCPEPK